MFVIPSVFVIGLATNPLIIHLHGDANDASFCVLLAIVSARYRLAFKETLLFIKECAMNFNTLKIRIFKF
jgi:hypothetical protein